MRATREPIAPAPTSPTVVPSSSRPEASKTKRDASHRPSLTPSVAVGDAAQRGEHHADGVLGGRRRVAARRERDGDAVLGGGVQVRVDRTAARDREQLQVGTGVEDARGERGELGEAHPHARPAPRSSAPRCRRPRRPRRPAAKARSATGTRASRTPRRRAGPAEASSSASSRFSTNSSPARSMRDGPERGVGHATACSRACAAVAGIEPAAAAPGRRRSRRSPSASSARRSAVGMERARRGGPSDRRRRARRRRRPRPPARPCPTDGSASAGMRTCAPSRSQRSWFHHGVARPPAGEADRPADVGAALASRSKHSRSSWAAPMADRGEHARRVVDPAGLRGPWPSAEERARIGLRRTGTAHPRSASG